MEKNWYISHGYKVSSLIEQSEIDRAEQEVTAAYILPITGAGYAGDLALVDNVTGALAYMLLLSRSIFLTRAGAKTKAGAYSNSVEAFAILEDMARSCALYLSILRHRSDVQNPNAEVSDICKIYFKTNFLYN